MSKPRVSNKNNKDVIRRLFQPSGNIAFLDAEFNSGMDYRTGESINEVISIGLIICNAKYEELTRYYSLVNPKSGKAIFPKITQMTGISSAMLKNQPGFATVSEKITSLFREYEVWDLFSWGNADQHSLMLERNNLREKRYASPQTLAKWTYIDMCTDISSAVSSLMLGIKGGLAINVENLMYVCEITDIQDHNALNDAFYLYQCMKYLSDYFPPENATQNFQKKRTIVNQYYTERSTYNSFRRFRANGKGMDLYGQWNSPDFLEKNEKDMRIKALEDDLAFLKGEIPSEQEFGSIQEYFNKNFR